MSPSATASVRLMREQELELLRWLAPRHDGTGLADLHAHGPNAVEVADRLVARGDATRYPGCLFGVSTQGRLRLALADAPAVTPSSAKGRSTSQEIKTRAAAVRAGRE